jgi:hypothetical protein
MIQQHTHKIVAAVKKAEVHHHLLAQKSAKALTMADINAMFASSTKVPKKMSMADIGELLKGAEAQFPVQGLDRGVRAEDFFEPKQP